MNQIRYFAISQIAFRTEFSEGLLSARRGDYWVGHLIDDEQAGITTIAAQHRADVRRPR